MENKVSEKEKYYTPSIQEFHVGFECEWQCKIRKETWNKQICDTDLVNIAYSAIEHSDEEELYSEQFRVKYLDKEDIESFGFKFDGKGTYKLSNYCLTGQLEYQNIEIEQTHEDVCMGEWKYYDELIFRGKIKNKSEFSRLLKQLSII
ncbi:hypothetical protein [uncultured Clostridium sp.]|uniref:hypothetical protein n=1 Tax=uncultured Clostridium sp. TaxID=59620 RepID=UPI002605D5EB|nr:hypothetical protein [uncultured Clostridium sp.]